MERSNSAAYWGSDSWDPDQRVYVGCSIDGADKVAVEDKDSMKSNTEKSSIEPLGISSVSSGDASSIKRAASSEFWDHQADDVSQTPKLHDVSMMPQFHNSTTTAGYSSGAMVSRFQAQETAFTDQGSTSYWEAAAAGTGRLPQNRDEAASSDADHSANTSPQAAIKRADSGAYWFAEAWDPDERVYVGASSGQNNHRIAVLEEGGEAISRAWAGGLVSKSLDVGITTGGILTLSEFMGQSPSVKELYEIESRSCGAGAFAEVRPGLHRKSGTRCAVKILSKIDAGIDYKNRVETHGGYAHLLRMTQEAPNEHVVHYLDFLEGPEHYYSVMEELRGSDLLEQVEKDYPLSESYCKNVMRQVLCALTHMHDTMRLAHRDIKMANFRFREGQTGLAVLDLQFACDINAEWDKKVCGTPALMAPELVAKSVDKEGIAAMDIWSAGVIFHRLLSSGDYPFQSKDEIELLAQSNDESAALLSKVLSGPKLAHFSDQANSLLRQLLTLDAAARPAAKVALRHPWFE